VKKKIEFNHKDEYSKSEIEDMSETLMHIFDEIEEKYMDELNRFVHDIWKELREINYFNRSQAVGPGKIKDYDVLTEKVSVEIPEAVQENGKIMKLLKHSTDAMVGGEAFEIEETDHFTMVRGNAEHMEELMGIIKHEESINSEILDMINGLHETFVEAKKNN